MGLITEALKITPKSNQISYFRNLGYVFNNGDEVEIKVSDLNKGSHVLVDYSCDYCGKILTNSYRTYLKAKNGVVHKAACYNCKVKKTIESNQIVYGVNMPSELEEVKQRVRDSNYEKYGKDYYTQTDEYIERVKKTNLSKYGIEWCINAPEVRERMSNSLMEHYGVSCTFDSPEIRERSKQTIIERYNVENVSQHPDIKEKKKQSCLKTTGFEYALQSPEIRKNYCQHMLDKYNVENPMQSPEIKQRSVLTNISKYGFANPMQNEDIKQKARLTNFSRYGVEYPGQSPEIRKKMNSSYYINQTKSTSKQQKYIAALYRMELNYPILYWNVDMYDKENKICCEYDGGGHFLTVELGNITQEEFDNKELVREKLIRQNGYKIVRIITSKDLLPSDTILLQMLSDAKQYFSDYPEHSWIQFNIDNEIVRNAENKDGVPYFYGELRRIKKTDIPISA